MLADYSMQLEVGDATAFVCDQRAFILNDNDLCKIIRTDKLNTNEQRNIRRILSNALCFIYNSCQRDVINKQYRSWQDFFDACFTDIVIRQSYDGVMATSKMKKELENYKDLFTSYTCLYDRSYESREFLKLLAIVILSLC